MAAAQALKGDLRLVFGGGSASGEGKELGCVLCRIPAPGEVLQGL
jgi:hypothetical protein